MSRSEKKRYAMDLRGFAAAPLYPLGEDFAAFSPTGHTLSFNNAYMEMDGRPFFAVSGEFHYSRMHENRWEDEIIKMRMGGVNIVSTYLFWNHIEEEEGVFDFTGQRDLRRFVELCRKHGLWVILRIGPFDHGEVRNGGLPDWLYGKPFEVRTTDPGFLACVRRLYEQIARQTRGLYFREGGPIIAVQLDNEYMHSSAMWEMTTGISDEWVFRGDEGEAYILALKEIALSCGMAPAFFTGTAWGGAAYCPSVLPLWGGYAYRPWIFYSHRGEHPATEEYVYEDYHHNGRHYADDFNPPYAPESRPYACCEMGGGMMCSYYYRFILPWKSVDAMANIKLGSGCSFLGYYMFQGGTNPLGKRGEYLNEAQVPKRSYDYQAALGEFGQIRESYSRLKSIHLFTRFFGDRLLPMETVLPEGASEIDPRDTDTLRYAVRTDGRSGFLFLNNFQDHLTLPAREHEEILLTLKDGTVRFDVSLASEENAILPFRMDLDGILLLQAHAQPVLRTEVGGRSTWVFFRPEGMDGQFRFEDGVKAETRTEDADACLFTVSGHGRETDVLLISREMADRLFLLQDGTLIFAECAVLEGTNGELRLESERAEETLLCYPPDALQDTAVERQGTRGPLGVCALRTRPAEIRVETEACGGFRYRLHMTGEFPENVRDVRLKIDYRGDIGQLFLENEMVHDHFCNGDIWEFGLMEYREALNRGDLILVIRPLREGAAVIAETAMAARSEEAAVIRAELTGVRAQPVYGLTLRNGE